MQPSFLRGLNNSTYSKNTGTTYLVLYSRQIDDIFRIWIEDKHNPNRWNKFKHDLNHQCNLEWNTEDLSNQVKFPQSNDQHRHNKR